MKIKIAGEFFLIVKEGLPQLAQHRASLGDATKEELPKYCDVIIARWESLTGQTAQLLSKPL
jgi:hypothetical protein